MGKYITVTHFNERNSVINRFSGLMLIVNSVRAVAANSNLSQCKDCGGTVSIQAASCPHCGTPNPSGTTGVLIIKRQHRSFVASLAELEVTFNSNPLGKLKNGETKRWNVEPGTHKLGIGNQYPKEIDITINPNRETIVEFKATADQAMQVAFGNRLTGMHESPIKILSIRNR